MQNITLEDQVYQAVSIEAARLNMNVDTYISTTLLGEIGRAANNKLRSKMESGIGLFADLPDSFDAVMESILDDRNLPWDMINDKGDT